MKNNIDPEAHLKTDDWAEQKPKMKTIEKMTRVKSGKKEENLTVLHRVTMGFKVCLRRICHVLNNLQNYLEEYTYSFNRNKMKGDVLENLTTRMVKAKFNQSMPFTSA
jgi:hypothetical protein